MPIKDFIERISYIKNLSFHTVNTYRLRLNIFYDFLKKHNIKNISDVTINDIEQFNLSLAKQGKRVNTRGEYLSVIKQFFKYAIIHDYNVMSYEKILLPKKEKIKIESCTETEIKSMIKHIKNKKFKNILDKKRALAIIYTLLGTGVRVSELINIRINDLGECITVKGKGGKIRCIPFPKEYQNYLIDYIQSRKFKSEFCFCCHAKNRLGNKITRVSIESIIRDIAFCSGISKTRPHKIRHTYATILLRNGVSIFHISKLLGHESVGTTQKYLTCYDSDLKEAVTLLPQF